MSDQLNWARFNNDAGLDWARFDHSSSQDMAEFNLSSVERMTRLEMDIWRLDAELRMKNAEIAKKWIEVATDAEKLHQYRVAFNHQQNQLRIFRKRFNRAQKTLEIRKRDVDRANILLNGEYIGTHMALTRGWNALVRLANEFVAAKLASLGMSSASAGDFFHHKKQVTSYRTKNIWAMAHWCKRWNVVPKMGTQAQQELLKIFALLHADAVERITKLEEQAQSRLDALKAATDQLFQLTQGKV